MKLSIKVYLYINKDLYYHAYKQSNIVLFLYIFNYIMFYINIYPFISILIFLYPDQFFHYLS